MNNKIKLATTILILFLPAGTVSADTDYDHTTTSDFSIHNIVGVRNIVSAEVNTHVSRWVRGDTLTLTNSRGERTSWQYIL